MLPEKNIQLTQTGAETSMGKVLRRYWLPAFLSSELAKPDSPPVRLRLVGENLVGFRDTDGKVGILGANCPHRGAPLFFGRNENGGLTCIYHGWKFDTSGNCLATPNVPTSEDENFCSKIHHTAYPTLEHGGIIWTYMGPTETKPDQLPPLEWVGLGEEQRLVTKQLLECNFVQAMEGDFDPSHLSFLHGTVDAYSTYGDRLAARGQDVAPEPADGILTPELDRMYWHRDPQPTITVMPTPYGMFSGARREGGPTTYYWRFNQFVMPFYAGVPWDTGELAQCNVWVPRDDYTTVVWRVSYNPNGPVLSKDRERLLEGFDAHMSPNDYAEPTEEPQSEWYPHRNRHNDYGIDRNAQSTDSFTGIYGIWAQDRAVTEGMGSIIDRSKERLVSSDAPIAHIRNLLLTSAKDLDESNIPPPSEKDFPRMTVVEDCLRKREEDWESVGKSVLAQVTSGVN